jgi:polyketide biosynthesis enoyl-CoA hydratase PksH
METANQVFQTIKLSVQKSVAHLQVCRPEAENSINATLIKEMMTALIWLEQNEDIKVVVLEGSPEYFCTGMDFNAVGNETSDALFEDSPDAYYELLKHFTGSSKIIVSKIEGKVNAGGVGLVAASDIVIAHTDATFSLSEALFGLLPACVMPFLIRRIGYQKAKWMTLTTQSISADRAFSIGLADEVSTNVNDTLRRNLLRLTRLETATVRELKDYMSALWIINEETQQLAVRKITDLMSSEKVRSNIQNFVQNGMFPWE